MSKHVYSVTALVSEVRSLLESSYREIWVEGEISNLATPASGHLYFSLKEGASLIRCVMFKQHANQIITAPVEGMKVLLRGHITVYEARGDMQIRVAYFEDAGEGALRREFEKLKQKLAGEGLFDAEHKQPLPTYPQVIGIISSDSGAALHDILVTLKRRYPIARLVIYPTLVQGANAADNIVEMLNVANERRDADLLILARGGGSLEDLQAFNQEQVARAMFASSLPLVSAIGHEVDFTIADMVADVRAPTPTAAAETVAPEVAYMKMEIERRRARLCHVMTRVIETLQQNLDYAGARMAHPLHQLKLVRHEQQAATSKLGYLMNGYLDRQRLRMQQSVSAVRYHSPQSMLTQNLHALAVVRKQLRGAAVNRFATTTQTISHLANQLNVVSPMHTLERGYAILQDQHEQVVVDASRTSHGQVLTASVARGKFRCVVDRVVDE